jgi:SAM-dependent methyltransferase
MTLDRARERLRPHVLRAKSFTGWLALPETRLLGEPLPWDYMQLARPRVRTAGSVLDMGTGGGERFAELCEGYSCRAVASEEWHVNARVAAEHLRQAGAHVVHAQSSVLPFAAESFDLVLNRHEDLQPAEVARVLQPGGTVLTQQVDNDNWRELRRFFPRHTDWGNHFSRYRSGFVASGLTVERAQRHEATAAFASLEDFVYMLCIAPWEIPDFDPLGDDLRALLEMEQALTTADGLVLTSVNYLIEAHKPV